MADSIATRIKRTPLFKFFSSLKLAVFSLLSLSAVLGTATVLESNYGTRAVYLMVYGTWWFYGLAVSSRHQRLVRGALPLSRGRSARPASSSPIWEFSPSSFGSYLTMQFGVDGNLPVVEGDSDSRVILTGLTLTVEEAPEERQQVFPVTEHPLLKKGELMEVAFGSGSSSGDKLVVTEWIPRAVQERQFVASPTHGRRRADRPRGSGQYPVSTSTNG